MRDLSIEYAHIYTRDKIGEEQQLSVNILRELYAQQTIDNQTISLVVMVDDYSFPDPTFNYDEFLDWLGSHGFRPDGVIQESKLLSICDVVLKCLTDERLKKELMDYISSKKYPCSLFIAAWYLVRLGYIPFAIFPAELCAKKLINILPESFKPFEDKALEIIAATPYSEAVDKIEYKFFKGRAI
jgi:hypothetical protein